MLKEQESTRERSVLHWLWFSENMYYIKFSACLNLHVCNIMPFKELKQKLTDGQFKNKKMKKW